jgi:hypothetical protein
MEPPTSSFWEKAPVQNILTSIPRSIPFLNFLFPNSPPSLLENSPKLIPELQFEKDFNHKNSLLHLRRIKPNHVIEYNAFLQKYFYPSNIGYIRSYRPYYFHSQMAKGLIYGLELRKGNHLVGLILCKHAGTLETEQIGLVTDICVHPEYRKDRFANILLEGLYSCSVFDKNIKIHFFEVDSIYLSPGNVPVLNSKIVYGKKQTERKHIIRGEKITNNILEQIYTELKEKDPACIWIEPTSIDALENIYLYSKESFSYVILRVIDELDSENKEGAEVIYFHGPHNEIDEILDSTPFEWFESKTKLSDSWTLKGNTFTYAFHLNYGSPSRRSLYYF